MRHIVRLKSHRVPQTCMKYFICLIDSSEDGIAQGNDALTMLDYPQTRNNYIDEILEVCKNFFYSPSTVYI